MMIFYIVIVIICIVVIHVNFVCLLARLLSPPHAKDYQSDNTRQTKEDANDDCNNVRGRVIVNNARRIEALSRFLVVQTI